MACDRTGAYTVSDTVDMTIRAVVQVDSIEVVSRPQSQDTYKFGETIGIDVTFTALLQNSA